MDTDIASVNGISVPDKEARISPKRMRFALAFSLFVLLGISMLAALMAIT